MLYKRLHHTLRTASLLFASILFIGCASNTTAEIPTSIPTITQAPTNTPIPTATQAPTNTPIPTATQTPTNTPVPTATLAPTNTPTPPPTQMPSATPTPTLTTLPPNTLTPTITPKPNFYRVSGTSIVDSFGNPVYLKGIAMGNMVWNSFDPPTIDHTEDSFRELAALGFDNVRFYLSCHYFEENNKPYTYREVGFDWLDENIAWAKKYGIRLILNMHAPQGGYQSQGKGLALWQEEENQNRLIALWSEIARRYADEETIIGYGLINEPVAPLLDDIPSSVAQCTSLMQRITDGIRTYDKNHIIFAERLCALVNPETGESDWSITYDDIFYVLDDDNTVYEFHTYAPHSFTHQNMDWADTAGKITAYPSDDPILSDPVSYWTGCVFSKEKETLEDGWTLFESDFITRTENGNAGSVTLRASNTGFNGIALFDDIVVEEYKNGTFHRIITSLDFETETEAFNFWSQDNSGKYYFSNEGYQNSRCVAISGTTSDANISGYRFLLREDCEYKIRGKVKKLQTAPECSAVPRIDFSLFSSVTYCDSKYLENELRPYLKFREKNQVPIYLGEFGVCLPAWEYSTGADQWVIDMITLCDKYQIHFNYHAYHDYWFGLHRLTFDNADTQKNERLEEIFLKMLRK